MTDMTNLVAAIFTASICAGKPAGPNEYLEMYDQFRDLLKQRAEKEIQDRIKESNKRMTSP
jgi:hypothetical protein